MYAAIYVDILLLLGQMGWEGFSTSVASDMAYTEACLGYFILYHILELTIL